MDGFSRCVVYIKCANIVLETFLEGVSIYGEPALVCSDHGGENVEVWRHMLSLKNDPSCVLTGGLHIVKRKRGWGELCLDVSPKVSLTH